jgi:hypothetical protein
MQPPSGRSIGREGGGEREGAASYLMKRLNAEGRMLDVDVEVDIRCWTKSIKRSRAGFYVVASAYALVTPSRVGGGGGLARYSKKFSENLSETGGVTPYH